MTEKEKNKNESLIGLSVRGIKNIVNRFYRETGAFQWLRELTKNSIEAEATKIYVGIEWQAVESKDIYRRYVADNGNGMSSKELLNFFSTIGEGGKPVGGEHENFAMGSKVSLLPWNKHGLVVISYKDGNPSMIWMKADPEDGEYGLRRINATNPETGISSESAVYEPFFDKESGCDWREIAPEWLRNAGHGTVVVMMGDTAESDSILGAPNREESGKKAASRYLNTRYEEFGDIEITIEELNRVNKSDWPKSFKQVHKSIAGSTEEHRPVNHRKINGAKHFVKYPHPPFSKGKLGSSGKTTLSDGTVVEHYLWEGKRPEVGDYAQRLGYIATCYRNELYHITDHYATYRSFGITPREVKRNLTIFIRPPEAIDEGYGIYPSGERNRLLLKTKTDIGLELPVADWAAEWAESMPEDIRAAIKEARGSESGSLEDGKYRERLAEKFGDKWPAVRLRLNPAGNSLVDSTDLEDGDTGGRGTESNNSGSGSGGLDDGNGRGAGEGNGDKSSIYTSERPIGIRASKANANGGIPEYRWASEDDFEKGILATWCPNDPDCDSGVVVLNRDHSLIQAEIERFIDDYGSLHSEFVEKTIKNIYGSVAVSQVAHSEHFKAILPEDVIENEFRSDKALTMGLLGLWAIETLIINDLEKTVPKRRKKAA